MKNIIKLSFILVLSIAICNTAFAFNLFNKKTKIDNSPSINYLKDVTEQGKEVRSQDVPMEKADIEADTERSIRLKKEYIDYVRKSCKDIEIKK